MEMIVTVKALSLIQPSVISNCSTQTKRAPFPDPDTPGLGRGVSIHRVSLSLVAGFGVSSWQRENSDYE
jgi:hypothetical protein